MGGKMNWDRVRKENQIGRSGSTWIGSDALSQTPSREVKSSRKRKSTKKRQPSGWAKIPGCTCGKALGFQGSHKKKCPFGGADAQRGSSSYNNPFAECVKKAGSGLPQRQFLLSLQTEVRLAPGISVSDRAAAQKLIQALLESSSARPDRNQQRNKANGLSDWHPLKELIERRLDVYLRAPTNAALAAVDSVASELSLQSYRFQCSTSTSDWELWGHIDKGGSYHPTLFSKAFTNGGVFCIERLEKSPDELQFWIKDCFDGGRVIGNTKLKRHPDFVLVLTSPVGIRQLWSGSAEASFVDRFVHLEKL